MQQVTHKERLQVVRRMLFSARCWQVNNKTHPTWASNIKDADLSRVFIGHQKVTHQTKASTREKDGALRRVLVGQQQVLHQASAQSRKKELLSVRCWLVNNKCSIEGLSTKPYILFARLYEEWL